MALGKRNKKATGKKKPAGPSAIDRLKFRLWIIMLLVIFMAYLPLALTLLVGMAPTVVQFLTERERRKFKARTVGYVNFVACLYVIAPSISKGPLQPLGAAWELILNPTNLLIMYSSAVLGLIANIILPTIASVYIAQRQERQKRRLIKERNRLLRYWGDRVGRLSVELLSEQELQQRNKSKQRAMQQLLSAFRGYDEDGEEGRSYYDKDLASFEQRYGEVEDHLDLVDDVLESNTQAQDDDGAEPGEDLVRDDNKVNA
ncbi:MAG: hypothetical protein AAF352_03010 [Pseudomonadota bacterium]